MDKYRLRINENDISKISFKSAGKTPNNKFKDKLSFA